jgi:hypothetical protein
MSGQAQIDYDALADQARKRVPAPAASASKKAVQPAIDYTALAAQARQTQAVSPSSPTAAVVKPPGFWDRYNAAVEPYVAINPHNLKSLLPGKNGQYDASAYGHEAMTTLGNIGGSALGLLLHPINTATGAAKFAWDATDPKYLLTGRTNSPEIRAMDEAVKHRPLEMIEQGIGQAGATAGLGEAIPKVLSRARAVPESLARAATNTGKSPVEQLVKDTQAANEKIDAVNQNRIAAQQAKQSKATQGYTQKFSQTIQQNRAAAAAERAKSDQAAHLQVGGSQLIYGLRQLDKALRAKANDLYGAVREKMAGASLPSDTLADGVKAAQTEWIRGSPAKVAEFNAMMSPGQPGPELVLADQTAQNMGYKDFRTAISNPAIRSTLSRALPPDVWDAAIGQGTRPISWNDLQGFYEETGAKIADGPQPGKGDIYKAIQQVHQFVGDQMQQLADAQGVGPQHRAARAFYRDYMNTFHEPTGPSSSGSPVAQALLAKDPLAAADKFAGDSGDRGIAILRRYSDSLANLAQDVQRAAREKITVPARKTMAGTSQPVIPLELKPRQTISSPDIAAARRAAAETRANKVWNRGQWAATWPIFQAARALWGGRIPSIPMMGLESAGMLATVKATTGLLRYPPMIRFLEQARPEDIPLIPPELRGDLPGLVSIAQRQGVRVSPALAAAAATTGTAGQQPAQPSSLPISPAQAIQAMQPAPAPALTTLPQGATQ